MARYGFTSPGAMAGDAITNFLRQRELDNQQRLMEEFTRQQQTEQMALQQRRQGQAEEDSAAQRTRQARLDAQQAEERDTAQRQQQNVAGVRGMMADAMTQGPLTPESAKTIGIMAFREGMEAPPEVQQMQAAEKTAGARSAELADYEARKMIDASVAPQDAEDPWASAGQGVIYHKQTGDFRQAPDGSGRGSSGEAGADYGIQTADRTIAAIDGVLPKINNATAGVGGRLLAKTGLYQPAVDVDAELQTVAGNIAFNALQQMRNASKTGGALGSVAQQELQLLQSVEGSLRQDQSPGNLKAQLEKVKASMERFKAAQAMGGDLQMGRSSGGTMRQKWVRDASGRLVRGQ